MSKTRKDLEDLFKDMMAIRGTVPSDPPKKNQADDLSQVLHQPPGQPVTRKRYTLSFNAGADNQHAAHGKPVAAVPVLTVRNEAGGGVGNVRVSFRVTRGGGLAGSGSCLTNAAGEASVTAWNLGYEQDNELTAVVEGAEVAIRASAYDGQIELSRVQQVGQKGKSAPEAPTVRVVDRAGRPVAGVRVAFAVQGGGNIANAFQETNRNGEATAGTWTLAGAGPHSVTASVVGVPDIVFNVVIT